MNMQCSHKLPTESWHSFYQRLHSCIAATTSSSPAGGVYDITEGFAMWLQLCSEVRRKDGVIFFIGNGASSSMASHFMTDVGKNAGFRTQVFSDAALLTALGNDSSFDQVFTEPLGRNGRPGDMLIAVSSSGNSPNIVEAVRAARSAGMRIVTLSGMDSRNLLRGMGDLNFWVNAESYGMVETAHAAILHYWTDCLVAGIRNTGNE